MRTGPLGHEGHGGLLPVSPHLTTSHLRVKEPGVTSGVWVSQRAKDAVLTFWVRNRREHGHSSLSPVGGLVGGCHQWSWLSLPGTRVQMRYQGVSANPSGTGLNLGSWKQQGMLPARLPSSPAQPRLLGWE